MTAIAQVIEFPVSSIQTLSFDEMEQVDGGVPHAVLAVACAAGGFGLGAVVAVGLIYLAMNM